MEQFKIIRIMASAILTLGFISLAVSILYISSIAAFIGLALVFWGAILLYITPTKHVKLELLNATAHPTPAYIEKMIAHTKAQGKGIYLPPGYFPQYESTQIFIPLKPDQSLPKPGESVQGTFLTPPGLALSHLFEETLKTDFLRTDLNYLQQHLPQLFIKQLKIAQDLQVTAQSRTVTVQVTNHIFTQACQQTMKKERVHQSVGCPLCSSLACALTKATGKPVTIQKEEQDQNTTTIRYRILEE